MTSAGKLAAATAIDVVVIVAEAHY